jgi:hypothetical protein
MRTKEIVLSIRDAGCVRVGRRSEAKFVRVETLGVLECEAVLERLAGIAADDMRNTAGRIAQEN